MSTKRIAIAVLAIAILAGFAFLGFHDAVKRKDQVKFQEVQLKSQSSEIQQLNVKYDKLNQDLDKAAKQKDSNKQQIERLNKEKADLEQQKKDLESQLQAKLEQKSKLALASERTLNTVTGTATASAASISTIDCDNQNTAKAFVYCHESGNDPTLRNSSGCYGLGQDCNGIVYNRCGADYACQDSFFTSYMQHRYGSWEKAKSFWLARVPINGQDVGNWW